MRPVGRHDDVRPSSVWHCRFYSLACCHRLPHTAQGRKQCMRPPMKIDDVRKTAYSMPLTSPSFPPGPYRFFNREYFIITYRTDPEALAKVVPEPLEITDSIVKYEFIRMPDSTAFGDYTETRQVIP